MIRFKQVTIPLMAIALLSACNGGGDDSGSSTATPTLPPQPAPVEPKALNADNIKEFASTSVGIEFASPLDGFIDEQATSQSASPIRSTTDLSWLTKSLLSKKGVSQINTPLTLENFKSMAYGRDSLTTGTISQSITRPDEHGIFAQWIVKTVNSCAYGGSITTKFIDWDNSGKMDMSGESGVEIYNNCNDGHNIIDGEFAMMLGENIEYSNGKYLKLNAQFEYSNLRIATINSVINYNGYFQGVLLNDNKRNYTRYLGSNFDYRDGSDRFFTLKWFDINKTWYDTSYGQAEFTKDDSAPPLAQFASIDSIPSAVRLHDDDKNSATELAGKFFVDQSYFYQSSDIDSKGNDIEVRTQQKVTGAINGHPDQGVFVVNLPGYTSRMEMYPDKIQIQWGETFYGENTVEYEWTEFQDIARAIRP